MNMINVDVARLLKAISVDNSVNREFDEAASEIRKNAKVWFTKTSFGGRYKLTHWGSIEIPNDEVLRNVIESTYSDSIATKIIDLLDGASMCFTASGVKNLTQFKAYWANYFRPLITEA